MQETKYYCDVCGKAMTESIRDHYGCEIRVLEKNQLLDFCPQDEGADEWDICPACSTKLKKLLGDFFKRKTSEWLEDSDC